VANKDFINTNSPHTYDNNALRSDIAEHETRYSSYFVCGPVNIRVTQMKWHTK